MSRTHREAHAAVIELIETEDNGCTPSHQQPSPSSAGPTSWLLRNFGAWCVPLATTTQIPVCARSVASEGGVPVLSRVRPPRNDSNHRKGPTMSITDSPV